MAGIGRAKVRLGRLVACAVVAAGAAVPRPAAGAGPGVGSVLFPANGTLWKVSADGLFERVALPSGKAGPVAFYDRSAFVSPDGKLLAAVPPGGDPPGGFWLVSLDGRTAKWIRAEAGPRPEGSRPGPARLRGWSCDGRALAYETTFEVDAEAGPQPAGTFVLDVGSGATEPVGEPDELVGLLDADGLLALSSAKGGEGPALWRVDRRTQARRKLAELKSRHWPPLAEVQQRGCGLLTVLSWHAGPGRMLGLVDVAQGTVVETRAIPDRWPVVIHASLSPSGRRVAYVGRTQKGGSAAELMVDDRSIYAFKKTYSDLEEGATGHRWIDDRTIVLQDDVELVVLDADTGKVKGCRPDCPAERPALSIEAGKIDALRAANASDVRVKSCYAWTTPLPTFRSDLSPATFVDGRTGESSSAMRLPTGWRLQCVDAVYVGPDGRRFRVILREDDRNGALPFLGGPLVAESDVRDELPTAEAFLRGARGLLVEGALDEAEEVVRRAVEGGAWSRQLRPAAYADSAELWTLRAAIAAAKGDEGLAAGSRAQLEHLRARGVVFAARGPSPEAAPELSAGEEAYVAATRLRLRAQPAENAPVVAHAPIGRAARVVAILGGWARLRAVAAPSEPDQWTVLPSGPKALGPAAPEPRELEGWAPVALLSRRLPDRAGLLAAADAAEKSESWPDAQRALERAAALEAPDHALLARLAHASALAGDYEAAARWAVASPQIVADGRAYARIAARFALGCRGDRARAVRVYPIPITDRFACDPRLPDAQLPEKLCPESQELVAAFPPDACVVGVAPPCPYCLKVARRVLALGNPAEAAPDANVARLARMFSDGPWIEAEIIAPCTPFAPDQRIFLVVDGERVVSTGIPWPAPGRPLTLWIPAAELGKGTWRTVGFVTARSEEEARDRVRALAAAKPGKGRRGSLETLSLECACRFLPDWRPDEGD